MVNNSSNNKYKVTHFLLCRIISFYIPTTIFN
uniref:Uncharacterized protein n=1 Tax=Rhizophora mucronata TaxID=61149 RepID=A0A2P2NWR0_RHIMU